VHVPHLAIHILGLILRRLRSDWQRKYTSLRAWLSQCAEISVRSLSDVPSNKKSAILLTAVSGEIAS